MVDESSTNMAMGQHQTTPKLACYSYSHHRQFQKDVWDVLVNTAVTRVKRTIAMWAWLNTFFHPRNDINDLYMVNFNWIYKWFPWLNWSTSAGPW